MNTAELYQNNGYRTMEKYLLYRLSRPLTNKKYPRG